MLVDDVILCLVPVTFDYYESLFFEAGIICFIFLLRWQLLWFGSCQMATYDLAKETETGPFWRSGSHTQIASLELFWKRETHQTPFYSIFICSR